MLEIPLQTLLEIRQLSDEVYFEKQLTNLAGQFDNDCLYDRVIGNLDRLIDGINNMNKGNRNG